MYRATLAAQCQVTYRSPIFVGASKVSLAFATPPMELGRPLWVVPPNATRHMETASGAPGRSFLSRQA